MSRRAHPATGATAPGPWYGHGPVLCLLALAALVGCSPESKSVLQSKVDRVLPKTDKPAPPPDGGWTPEKISADPAGYLQYAANRVTTQIAGRKQKLNQLATQQADVSTRAQALAEKVGDAQNLAKRMRTAIQRAEDENTWPIKVAGRSFDQARAEAIIKSLDQFVIDRQSLVQAYRDAVARIGATQQALQTDIGNLEHMREKIGLDLERVRLNQGLAELGELHKTESELAAFAKTLADMSDDATLSRLGNLPALKAGENVDAESLLR